MLRHIWHCLWCVIASVCSVMFHHISLHQMCYDTSDTVLWCVIASVCSVMFHHISLHLMCYDTSDTVCDVYFQTAGSPLFPECCAGLCALLWAVHDARWTGSAPVHRSTLSPAGQEPVEDVWQGLHVHQSLVNTFSSSFVCAC